MATLANINELFAVDSTGAIKFNNLTGTDNQVLIANTGGSPTWVDVSTIIGGPYVPLSGNVTITGPIVINGSNSLTVGGALSGSTATFTGTISAVGASTFTLNDGIFIKAVNGSNNIAATNVWGYGLYEGASKLGEISLVRDGTGNQMYIGTTSANQVLRIGSANKVTALTIDASQNSTFAGAVEINGIGTWNTPAGGVAFNVDAFTDGFGVIRFRTNGNVSKWDVGMNNSNHFYIGNNGVNTALEIEEVSSNATFAGLVSGIAPTSDLNFATKKYVDDNDSGTVTGTGTVGRVAYWTSGTNISSDGAFRFDGTDVAIGGAIVTDRKLAIYNTNANNELQFIGTDYTNIYSETDSTMAVEVIGDGELLLAVKGGNLTIATGSGAATFTGIVGMGSTGIYAGTNAQLNLPGRGLAIKNDKNGSNNNWSYIENTATGSQSNINFYTGNNVAALTLDHGGDATFTENVTLGSGKYLGVGNTTPAGTRSKFGVSINVTGTAANLAESVTYATMELYPYRNGSTYGMFFGNRGVSAGYIQTANSTGNDSGPINLNPFGGSVGIGIGNTNPSYTLDVNGTIRATGDVIAYSDERVKENIKTIDNSLEKVSKLRGVSYTRKNIDDKSTKIGVIAQEVINILPEVVSQDDKGKYSVAYGNISGLLIEAIKELEARIKQLENK